MLIFPISTDVHDGKIRLAAIEIMTICVLVHLIVTMDTARINKKIQAAVSESNQRQQEYLEKNPPSSVEELMKMIENPPEVLRNEQRCLVKKIEPLKQSAILYKLAFIPAKFSVLSLFTALFVHGGWLHLIGNLIFFYVCGVAIEKYWGFWRFIIIYLFCGIGANLVYMASTQAIPEAANMPLVGASGAIAGAMGAFVVTHFRIKVKIFYTPFFIGWGTFRISSYLYFGFWFLFDLFNAFAHMGQRSGVAYSAHVGGFILGAILGRIVKSESSVSRISHAPTNQTQTRLIIDELDNEELSQPADMTTSPPIKTMPLSVLGWQAFQQGNYAVAVDRLTHAINNYFQSCETHRDQIIENITHILKFSDQLCFPASQIYQWAKNLTEMNQTPLAISCFDLSGTATNAHIKKNSLLNASINRIRTSSQLKKARKDLQKVIELDKNGILTEQAEQILGYMGKKVKTVEQIVHNENIEENQ